VGFKLGVRVVMGADVGNFVGTYVGVTEGARVGGLLGIVVGAASDSWRILLLAVSATITLPAASTKSWLGLFRVDDVPSPPSPFAAVARLL
jgi:uncharacterized membrane protein